MSATLWLIGLLALLVPVDAASGEDMASNLFTDIAPLLALFGERFAQQFMSEAFNWLDHIIFAMAPLGILTAIVSAVRVAGHPLLKALIGRARENVATAEVELMSSTSHEVCELWNGQAVVRTLGKPMVQQLVYLSVYADERDADGERTFGLYTLRAAREAYGLAGVVGVVGVGPGRGPVLVCAGKQGPFVKLWNAIIGRAHRQDEEKGDERAKPRAREAPNILINLHQDNRTKDLAIAAVIGVVLQAIVLVYSGIITYHPHIKKHYLKSGAPVGAYAFPTVAVGTVMLTFGMMICSYIIEQSTREQAWSVPSCKRNRNIHVMWLQKKHIVSDQSFNSFLLFSDGPRTEVQTSRRKDPPNPLPLWASSGIAKTLPEALTVLAVTTGLMGFILQYEGLHGMHWTSSLAQLLAIFLMTLLRAWVRRGLIERPDTWEALDEHEMDLLALAGDDPWKAAGDKKSREDYGEMFEEWGVFTREDNLAIPGEPEGDSNAEQKDPSFAQGPRGETAILNSRSSPDLKLSGAQRMVKVRQRLGHLTEWTGPASEQAISVAAAIETVMKEFFDDQHWSRFIWSVYIKVPGEKEKIDFTVNLQKGGWCADESEIEAVLSLWIAHIRHRQERERNRISDADRSRTWLRHRDPAHRRQYHQLLGPDTSTIRRDLDWWIGSDVVLETTRHSADIVTGFCGLSSAAGSRPSTNGDSPANTKSALRAVSSAKLELFLAQHLFSAFMWAVAKEIPADSIQRSKRDQVPMRIAAKETFAADDCRTWSRCLGETTQLSKLMTKVQLTGLGTAREVSMVMVPPLSYTGILPNEVVVDLVRHAVRQDEVRLHWGSACRAYLQLLDEITPNHETAEPAKPDRLTFRAVAAVVEFLMLSNETAAQRPGTSQKELHELYKLKSQIRDKLQQQALRSVLSILRGLYKAQSRLEQYEQVCGRLPDAPDPHRGAAMGRTDLHRQVLSREKVEWSAAKEAIGWGDIFDWTPLHYAALVPANLDGFAGSRESPDFKDMAERTPLHYAAMCGNSALAKALIKNGAKPEERGRDGMQPLHWAVKMGHVEVVKLLAKELGEAAKWYVADNWFRTPLHLAVSSKNLQMVKLLLKYELQLNTKDITGKTPLSLAEEDVHEGIVEALVKKGAKSNSDDGQEAALNWAVDNGNMEMAAKLIEKGASVDARDTFGGTVLHRAARTDHESVYRLLLDKVTDIAVADREGKTALHYVTERGRSEWVEAFLTKQPSDCAAKDKILSLSVGLLVLAAARGHKKVVKVFLDHGVNINAKDGSGSAAVHTAVRNAKLPVLKTLIKRGADISLRDSSGWAPLHIAACLGFSEGLLLLIQQESIKIDEKTQDGRTPLSLAEQEGHIDIVEILQKSDADQNSVGSDSSTPIHPAITPHQGLSMQRKHSSNPPSPQGPPPGVQRRCPDTFP